MLSNHEDKTLPIPSSTAIIAKEISFLMPVIGRRVLLGFFQSHEITPTQLFVITTLSEKSSRRLCDLSNELQISAPTVTGIIDRLEKSGYVKRIPDKVDRRAINIELTAQGKQFARNLRLTIKNRWQSILEKLSIEDREHYLRILRKIRGLL